ncbi:MAG: methylmalonyl Co-A mutase-associated GTPase MeaB [Anaerolineales bacterium]|nr:methylmalonyl Co-A mutase-associated GTPase MeaB [Anaerolineales bacterium]
MNLAASILEGNRLAIARLMTQVENDTVEGLAGLEAIFPHTGQAHLIGVTGAPGTGKSSLVNQLARCFRHPPPGKEPCRVGIIAVDPSSPFSGGAILGDRIRMRDLAGDPGVFIRSMATRGSLGGIAKATSGLIQILDAAGYQTIFIETVGAGQAEVDIARLAHTTLVVEAPGLGDDIQAIKAGILEIADILVLNKADRPGVESAETALRSALRLASSNETRSQHPEYIEGNQADDSTVTSNKVWSPPIIRTIAIDGNGIEVLAEKIEEHRCFLKESGEWKKREKLRLQSEVDALLQRTLMQQWRDKMSVMLYEKILSQVTNRKISTTNAVKLLMNGDNIQ